MRIGFAKVMGRMAGDDWCIYFLGTWSSLIRVTVGVLGLGKMDM